MEHPQCWNPKIRKSIATIASFGVAETAFLTVSKVSGQSSNLLERLCDTTGSACTNVLQGPYASIPGTDVPLSALGFMAYSTVVFLAAQPLVSQASDEDTNRTLLVAATTTMAVFSILLMALLWGVLHASCVFCVASAACSVVLAKLAWLGGVLPQSKTQQGVRLSVGGATAAAAVAGALLLSNNPTSEVSYVGDLVTPSTLVAASNQGGNRPPPILSESSPRAIELANRLQRLDARMYGAFWCSHCYDQKERLGKEAFAKIQYIECSKDGYNAQTNMCKDAKVPGYPTWSINGKIYPGEQELDELEEIITNMNNASQ